MIAEVLHTGKENAIPGRELMELLHISERDLTQAVELERRAGQPICAACGKTPGYYLAADQQEMQDYCGRLFHRAGEIHKTRKACLQTLSTLPPAETQKEQEDT